VTLVVVDASAVAAWVLPSQTSASANTLLEEARQHRFIVPHVFHIEVRSLLLAAERRGRWTRRETENALDYLDNLDIASVRMDSSDDLSAVLDLARSARLSMHDAFYLQLAVTDDGVLASRDKALLAAATDNRVPMMDLNL
jgi:predicted nucleic acid-binding protein